MDIAPEFARRAAVNARRPHPDLAQRAPPDLRSTVPHPELMRGCRIGLRAGVAPAVRACRIRTSRGVSHPEFAQGAASGVRTGSRIRSSRRVSHPEFAQGVASGVRIGCRIRSSRTEAAHAEAPRTKPRSAEAADGGRAVEAPHGVRFHCGLEPAHQRRRWRHLHAVADRHPHAVADHHLHAVADRPPLCPLRSDRRCGQVPPGVAFAGNRPSKLRSVPVSPAVPRPALSAGKRLARLLTWPPAPFSRAAQLEAILPPMVRRRSDGRHSRCRLSLPARSSGARRCFGELDMAGPSA